MQSVKLADDVPEGSSGGLENIEVLKQRGALAGSAGAAGEELDAANRTSDSCSGRSGDGIR